MSNRTLLVADARFRRRDWTSKELAQFHRLVVGLWNDGLSLETDGGVSDEGEPWFVFCDAGSGEVLAHFARISGRYVVWAPCLDGSLTGHILPDLIERFVLLIPPGVRHPPTLVLQDSVRAARKWQSRP